MRTSLVPQGHKGCSFCEYTGWRELATTYSADHETRTCTTGTRPAFRQRHWRRSFTWAPADIEKSTARDMDGARTDEACAAQVNRAAGRRR